MWQVGRLQPYDRNPRRHSPEQITALMAAITEFGFTAPVLVDETAGILAGHARLEAARRLGLTEVPVIELTYMTPAQKRAYVIADNKLPAMATWDERLLAAELRDLEDAAFNVHLTGFTDDDLQRLQDDLDHNEIAQIARGGDDAGALAPAASGASSSSSGNGAPAAGAPDTEPPQQSTDEQLPFSVVMEADNRARLFHALQIAKRKWNLTTSADALLAMANDFMAREGQ